MGAGEYALGFLDLVKRSVKPRTRGLSIVQDHGIGMHAAHDMVEMAGQYIDYVKIRHFSALTASLDPGDPVIRRIRLYEENDIRTLPGGIVFEMACAGGKVEETFEVLSQMGFTAVEVSDNIVELTPEEKVGYTKLAVKRGLRVLSEFGKKYGTDSFDVEETVEECRRVLDAGATLVVVEKNQLDLTLGPEGGGGPQAHKLEKLVEALTLDRVTFEAVDPGQQNWLFRTFGPDVSLGPNISPDRILYLEGHRRGLGRESGYPYLTDMCKEK